MLIGPGIGIDSAKEHLIGISLDLCWQGLFLRDYFEWDLTNPDNIPEEFA